MLHSVAGCCRVLQSVAGYCRVLQDVVGCCKVMIHACNTTHMRDTGLLRSWGGASDRDIL